MAGKPGTYLVSTQEGKWLRSTDGVTWTVVNTLPAFSSAIYCNGTRFCGWNDTVTWVSDNGIATAAVPVEITGTLPFDIAHSPDTWVAVSRDGSIQASVNNGVTWMPRLSPVGSITGVEWGSGKFIATTDSGSVLSSQDGLNWQLTPPNSTIGEFTNSVDFAYYNGRFFWGGFTSTTGTSGWLPLSGGGRYPLRAGANALVTATTSRVSTLINPDIWNVGPVFLASEFIGNLQFCGDIWILVTQSGKLFTSTPASLPAPAAPALTVKTAAEITWQSQTGRWYQMQRSQTGQSWTNTGSPMLGDGNIMKWQAPVSATKEFFRVLVK